MTTTVTVPCKDSEVGGADGFILREKRLGSCQVDGDGCNKLLLLSRFETEGSPGSISS